MSDVISVCCCSFSLALYITITPIRYKDPSGCVIQLSGTAEEQQIILRDLNRLTDDRLSIGKNGLVSAKDLSSLREGLSLLREKGNSFVSAAAKYFIDKMFYRPDGTEIVRDLIKSDKITTIVYSTDTENNNAGPANEDDWEKVFNGEGTDAIIEFNPLLIYDYYALQGFTNEGIPLTLPKKKPAYISLGHELIHALSIITGTAPAGESDYTYATYDATWLSTDTVRNEELATVGLIPGKKITENDILIEHGLLKRGRY